MQRSFYVFLHQRAQEAMVFCRVTIALSILLAADIASQLNTSVTHSSVYTPFHVYRVLGCLTEVPTIRCICHSKKYVRISNLRGLKRRKMGLQKM